MTSHQPIPAAASTRPRLRVVPGSVLHRLLLGCGVLGSLLFTGTFLAAGATRAGYDPWRQPISALSLGPGGWLQSVNFIVFGVLMGCFALGLRGALAPGTGAKWAPLLQAAVAAGLIIDGIFAQDPGMGYPPGTAAVTAASTHGLLHNIGLGLAATALPARCFVLARRFAREPRWRGWATYSIITGLLFIALLAAFGMASGTPSAPAGLFEKLATIQASIYTIALCTRLLATTARVSTPPLSEPALPTTDARPPPAAQPWPWWLTAIIILGAGLIATGAVMAIFATGEHLNTAGHNYADYFITRNLALAVMLLVMLALRARHVLAALMTLTALIQVLDAITATATSRFGLVPIDLIFAAAFLFGAVRLSGLQPWRRTTHPGLPGDQQPAARRPATPPADEPPAVSDLERTSDHAHHPV
jgi:Protein of unknown function (DUF998)